MPLIDYADAYEHALQVLGKMKDGLDRYRDKPDHNAQWAQEREDMIVTLGYFMQASEQAISELQAEKRGEFLRGYTKANKEPEMQQRNEWRRAHTLNDALKLSLISPEILHRITTQTKSKEIARKIIQEKTRRVWADHF